jgi:hypothetical protein
VGLGAPCYLGKVELHSCLVGLQFRRVGFPASWSSRALPVFIAGLELLST